MATRELDVLRRAQWSGVQLFGGTPLCVGCGLACVGCRPLGTSYCREVVRELIWESNVDLHTANVSGVDVQQERNDLASHRRHVVQTLALAVNAPGSPGL